MFKNFIRISKNKVLNINQIVTIELCNVVTGNYFRVKTVGTNRFGWYNEFDIHENDDYYGHIKEIYESN